MFPTLLPTDNDPKPVPQEEMSLWDDEEDCEPDLFDAVEPDPVEDFIGWR